METAIQYNVVNDPPTINSLIRPNNYISDTIIKNVIEKSINGNNTFAHITINHVIEYNKIDRYIEGKIIKMNVQIQSEINKIIKRDKAIHLSLFILSVIGVAISWSGKIVGEDISLILKPLSIAFSLMIVLNYCFRRIK